MDSKKGLIIVLIILLLLGGGYLYFNSQQAKQAVPGAASTAAGKAFGSIKDALSKSISLKCEYPDDKGNKVTTYIKAGAVRMMGYSSGSDGTSGQALMKDGKMYFWDDKTKEGTVISFDTEKMKEAAESVKTSNQSEDFLQGIEQYKDYCKTATVSDSLFTVPTDVKFVDLAEQMKKSGVDIEKLQQQYQQETPQETPSE